RHAGMLTRLQDLWPGRRLPKVRHEPDLGLSFAHEALEEGCFLRFDRLGELLGYGQYLASRMLMPETAEIVRLENLVAKMPLWLPALPEQWPLQIPELILKSRDGQPLVLAGSLCAEGENWLLQLVDISDSYRRLQDLERRRYFLEQSRQSARLLQNHAGNDQALLLDWLEEQCLYWQVPAAAVLLTDDSGWQVFQHYASHVDSNAEQAAPILNADLLATLAQLTEQPLQWQDALDQPI